VNRARLLRKKATDTERILWRHLRNRNFVGYKFRRQHPFGCYILDFYCPTAKLAIELDGGGHSYRAGQIRDRTRSESLARKGIIVLRFGIIRFARNSTASCKPSGLRCRSDAGRNPHLNPLPLAKGEASFLVRYLQSSIQAGIDKWQNNSLIQRRNSDEPNYNHTAGLSDLQENKIA
jgi:very-short-patch-repair endonuclease